MSAGQSVVLFCDSFTTVEQVFLFILQCRVRNVFR